MDPYLHPASQVQSIHHYVRICSTTPTSLPSNGSSSHSHSHSNQSQVTINSLSLILSISHYTKISHIYKNEKMSLKNTNIFSYSFYYFPSPISFLHTHTHTHTKIEIRMDCLGQVESTRFHSVSHHVCQPHSTPFQIHVR